MRFRVPDCLVSGGLRCTKRADAFFFNDTATTEIYTLSLHDALPIYATTNYQRCRNRPLTPPSGFQVIHFERPRLSLRSEEHTSELHSPDHLVCRLLLDKTKKTTLHPNSLPSRPSIPGPWHLHRTATL